MNMRLLLEKAKDETWGETRVNYILRAFELALDGNIEEANLCLIKAIGFSDILDLQLSWINHPERVEVTEVKITEDHAIVAVDYQEKRYETRVELY